MLKYCTRCIMPDTKPDLTFDTQGVCSACRSYENRRHVNWDSRHQELELVLAKHRSKSGYWDCVVPVSGGKDSTYQVIRVLELGMNPLCVTATTCDESEIGRHNITNIKNLGVDHIQMSPNPSVRARLNRIGLEEVGDISWPEHVGIFTIPVRAAINYGIPLIIWGENSQNEYGGPEQAQENNILDRSWLEEFGGLLGLRVSDLAEVYEIPKRNLVPYQYPTDEELNSARITGLFLGHYIPWDGMTNYLISQAHGFETYNKSVEGSMVNYENLDNHQTGIHDYFKFLKFGFSRATDIACLHLRRGRLTRSDALEIAKQLDGRYPSEYLGKSLEEIIEPLGLDLDEFNAICDRFTNRSIFKTRPNGELVKDRHGNLTKINYDN
jgi:N-acetyl sugar amidotransferase